ncbi:MAG: DoxX family protein [Gemmatimonadota bacterium]
MNRGSNPQLGLTVLRVVLGVTFIAHGAPKLFGGLDMTSGFFGQLGVPLPTLAAWGVALLEFLGGLGLIAGLLVTPLSILLGMEMFLGIIFLHARNGWYVVGGGSDGVEFNVLLIAALLMLILGGPGLAALDSRGRRRRGP